VISMSSKKILVFPAGTEIAFEIHSALKYSKFVEIYGGTSVPCHAEFVFKNCIEDFPDIHDDTFISFLNAIVDKYDIDYIYPAHDSVVMKLTQFQNLIHAPVVTSPIETVDICRSKLKTYEFFEGEAFIPKTYATINDVVEYPVFIKPSVGQGSEGAELIENRSALDERLKSDIAYVISEYLPGEEFTVDCFTDRHGDLLVVEFRQRERIRAGISVRSRLLPMEDAILSIAETINKRLVFNGAWFFQVKKNVAGEYRLMEISPRIPGTMCVSRNLGVNYPLLTLYNHWGYDVSIIRNSNEILLDRAFINRFKTDIDYQRIYVDFDDTIIVNGTVNPQLMMFLYQSLNSGKEIYLITKHAGDINNSLDKYHVCSRMFTEIIHLKEGEEKRDYINPDKAIFIDDSFSERKKIKDAYDIPVFDLDMIECLLDWRA